LVKHHLSKPPPGQGSLATIPSPTAPIVVEPAPNRFETVRVVPSTKQLGELVGDGPTYILTVPNLANFSLPIHSIMRLQNLLHRYDKLETLPNVIQLTAESDRWDFPPGVSMTVRGRKDVPQFAASAGGVECVFDYSEWLAGREESLAVQAKFDRVPAAFSMHFGFASSNDGDPFRLLVVNENNPPAPLRFGKGFVQFNHQDLRASLEASMWQCLSTNFELLAGRQWQLLPILERKSMSSPYLYKDWPTSDIPAFGCELDFAHIRLRLQAQRQDLKERLDNLNQPLGRPLGKFLGATNENLISFLAFSPAHPTPGRFLEYLSELKKSAPDKSWIKQWHNRPDSDQPEEVSANLQELYDLWSQKQAQDQPMLTVTNRSGTTNCFFDIWRHLTDNLKEGELMQDQLANLQKRLVDLEHVAYIGLCIVDPRRPGTGLEMIRFEGP
ncbi:MAG TPA: hypothetical protein VGR14_01015, partial [Verrucomicrobiae bacterium]|nr:hypothetical protein [Verrucomicrobiae bacterium]